MSLGNFSDPDYLRIIVRKLKSFESYESYLRRHSEFNFAHTRRTQNQKDLLSLSSEFASILEKGSVEITTIKKYAIAIALVIYGEHNCCYLDTVSILKKVPDEGVISLS
jgi:hypothetical protein